jgi:hypothetical protein
MMNKKQTTAKKIKSQIDEESARLHKVFKLVDDQHIKSLFDHYQNKKTENYSPLLSQYQTKLFKINDLILSIRGSKMSSPLNEILLNRLRELAISPGGFMKMEFRKFIYLKIFSSETNKLDFKSSNIFIEKSPSSIKDHKFEDIINKDVNRSVIYHIKNFESFSESEQQLSKDHTFITKKLANYLKIIFQQKTNKDSGYSHDYYQGFHDFSLYLLLLYIDEDQINTLKRITERIIQIYFKDYTDDKNKGVFTNIAQILRETVRLINPIIAKDIEDKSSEAIYYLCISWIICLYAQNFKDINCMYRMLDYILTSHPITIYITAAVVKYL